MTNKTINRWNKLSIKKSGAVLMLGAIFSSAPAFASTPDYRYYLVGQLGVANGEVNADDMNQRMEALGFDAEADISNLNRTAWYAGAGYHWNRFIDVEVGYTDLGEVRTHITGDTTDITAYLQGANIVHPRTASGYELALVANWPLRDDLGLFARAGWLRADTDYRAYGNEQIERRSHDENISVLGAGAYYHINEKYSLRFQVNHYPVEDEDINVWYVSILYRFGER
ncbi:MAG TPA: porin family protein [Cellvibrio sp.]|nr:porin family protein [Cellvibrio sp.]